MRRHELLSLINAVDNVEGEILTNYFKSSDIPDYFSPRSHEFKMTKKVAQEVFKLTDKPEN